LINELDLDMLIAYLEANQGSKVLLEPDQVDLILDLINEYEEMNSH
jgi:hypothetical protein